MISRRDEEGFSSCLACPCHRAVASTPPRQRCRIGQISAPHAAFALRLRARPSVSLIFEATFAFTVVTARWLVISPRKTLSIGFKVSVSLHPAIQTTGLLTLAPAGLSPAEHTSLRWTHNRTGRSPASGSRTRRSLTEGGGGLRQIENNRAQLRVCMARWLLREHYSKSGRG